MSRLHDRLCPILLLAAGLGACSKATKTGADSAGGAVAAAPATPAAPAAAPATAPAPKGIQVGQNQTVGRYITDPFGRSLYTFSKDRNNSSACAGKCADDWTPYAEPQVTTGGDATFDRTKIGTITRADSKTQITYAGKPLYFYSGDHAANEITGQSKKDYGGTWYLVAPSGAAIKTAVKAAVKTP